MYQQNWFILQRFSIKNVLTIYRQNYLYKDQLWVNHKYFQINDILQLQRTISRIFIYTINNILTRLGGANYHSHWFTFFYSLFTLPIFFYSLPTRPIFLFGTFINRVVTWVHFLFECVDFWWLRKFGYVW